VNVCNYKRPHRTAGARTRRCVAGATAEIIIDTVDGVFVTAACPDHQPDRIEEITDAGIWEEVGEDCSIVPHVVIDVRAAHPG
jgi:hypothetical protein